MQMSPSISIKTSKVKIDRKQIGIGSSSQIVNNKFEILFNERVSNYSSEFIQAYSARNLQEKESIQKFIALVCSTRALMRMEAIIQLNKTKISNFNNLEALSIITINGIEALVIIIKDYREYSLTNIISKLQHRYNEKELLQFVITPLLQVINQLHELEIMHGCINPDTIFILEEQTTHRISIILESCVLNACGSKQQLLYETIERGMLNKYSKPVDSFATDYYSLGATICYLLGKEVLFKQDVDILKIKMKVGSFSFFERHFTLTLAKIYFTFIPLISGLLNDKEDERFGYIEAIKALESKTRDEYNNNQQIQQTALYRWKPCQVPLLFNGDSCTHPEDLAILFTKYWETARNLVLNTPFRKWISAAKIDTALLVQITQLENEINAIIDISKLHELDIKDIYLACIVIALSPHYAPIVLAENIIFSPDAIPQVLNYGLVTTPSIQNKIFEFIESGGLKFVIRLKQILIDKNTICNTANILMQVLQQFDSMFYDLNIKNYAQIRPYLLTYAISPAMPCICEGALSFRICFSLKDILQALNTARELIIDTIPSKLFAFIAIKLISCGYKFNQSKPPKSAINKDLFWCLWSLGTAQKETNIGPLIHLCENIQPCIKVAIQRQIYIKKNAQKALIKLEKSVHEGSITAMFEILNIFQKDHNNYYYLKAKAQQIKNELKLCQLISNPSAIKKTGLDLAIRFSYVMLGLSAVLFLMKTLA